MTKSHILSIDQGTTSSRAIVYDKSAQPIMSAQEEFSQIYPKDGWVEHNPEAIWQSVLSSIHAALDYKNDIAAIGIANQRETCVLWERATSKPIYNAIVWQDRRTADICAALKQQGHEDMVTEKTGLLLDPYFSATKIAWILDHVKGARGRAENNELAFGTIDTFLIWRLTGGASHVTDATNASRTSLYNIETGNWDDELLALFNVPKEILPKVLDCCANFGTADKIVLGQSIPITGVAGDQQAAAIGQGCFKVGDSKSTYGTGCFVLLNTGTEKITSQNRLLSTIAYKLDGEITYALEGSIFIAGAAVQWLHDGIGIIKSASETEALARGQSGNNGLYLVPAFTGLGAPHWDPNARGAIFGITRATSRADFARAALESICYQTHDLLRAMESDGGTLKALKVDGGMAANDWLIDFLADILDVNVHRPANIETTALGAALLAGSHIGLYSDVKTFKNKTDKTFTPNINSDERNTALKGWKHAVSRVLT
ncbi:MAG: glycerol kinase GlpK [Robiginitomaculum sp.]